MVTNTVKTQRFLCWSEDVRANSKVEVTEEEMNLPWNKSPAQLITVLRSALLVSGLLWPDLPFMTLWLSQLLKPLVRHKEVTITKGVLKSALEEQKPKE